MNTTKRRAGLVSLATRVRALHDALAHPRSRSQWGTAAVLLLVLLARPGRAADSLARHSAETAQAFAKRVLPPQAELSAKPVEVELGALGEVVVFLFLPNHDASNYRGWVLVPQARDRLSYEKVVLPPLTVVDGRFSIEVMSIFADDVDADGSPELCVLSRYHEYGSRDDADLSTDCFRWHQDHFDLLVDSGLKTLGLKNAKAVRAYFAKHPLRVAGAKPPSRP
jgi:hypothetical protein